MLHTKIYSTFFNLFFFYKFYFLQQLFACAYSLNILQFFFLHTHPATPFSFLPYTESSFAFRKSGYLAPV